MTNYQEMKRNHSKDIDNFEGLFFAFNNQQFKEGMEKIGLTVDDKSKIFSIGAGGYMLKSKDKDFEAMLNRHAKERKELKENEKLLLEALIYELNNHEYCYTGDASDALESLGLTKDTINPGILKKACKMAYKEE